MGYDLGENRKKQTSVPRIFAIVDARTAVRAAIFAGQVVQSAERLSRGG